MTRHILDQKPDMTLKEWRKLLDYLEEYCEYSPSTILYADAGRSDCQLVLELKDKDKKDKS